VSAPGRSGSRRLTAGKVRNYAQSPPGAYAATRTTRTSFAHWPQGRALQGRRDCESGPAAAV
jgi:hypothetical protein